MVYVNDELKGTTPVTYDFVWYGWHRLTLRKDGYQRLDDRKLIRAPIWFWIPFDFAMELLPIPIPDRRTWSYSLTPSTSLPTPIPPALFKKTGERGTSGAATEPGDPAARRGGRGNPVAAGGGTTEPGDPAARRGGRGNPVAAGGGTTEAPTATDAPPADTPPAATEPSDGSR